MNTCTVKTPFYEVTFRTSIANTMLFRRLADEWVGSGNRDTLYHQQFAYIVAHIDAWDCELWTPPTKFTKAEMDRKFDEFYHLFTIPQMRELGDAVATLHKPIADAVEKPDYALTDDEASDPN